MESQQEQLEEVREDIKDIENLLQLLMVSLHEEEENAYILQSIRLAVKVLKTTGNKVEKLIQDCENI